MSEPALPRSCDAVVVGAGPNGLVAANLLADAGWDVVLLEAQPEPGGAVRSAEVLGPGVVSDLFSAFYPLAAASPVLAGLHLEEHGLRWTHAPAVLAHPTGDGGAAVLHRTLEQTVDGLEALHPGDGLAFRRLHEVWATVRDPLIAALFRPFPPVGPGLRLAVRLRGPGLLRLVRLALLPVRRLAEEEFGGDSPAAMLFAGNALHSDLGPEASGGALFGLLLTMLGQDVGFPVPEGGAGALSNALVERLRSRGGRLVCGAEVTRVVVRAGRAVGVDTPGGRVLARRAVLADVDAPRLYGRLVGPEHLPSRMRDDLRRFQWDYSTVKVNWLVEGGVPWAAADARLAGTVHLAPGLDDLTRFTADLACGRLPELPFVLAGQMSTADPSRSPEGSESLWAYTHIPRAIRRAGGHGDRPLEADDIDTTVGRVEAQLERFAPGFGSRVRARNVQAPWDLEAADANLSVGALNGGTAFPHQQLVLRPYPSLGRPVTPIAGLFLASASAHPGGGVHGACGANAARAARNRAGSAAARLLSRAATE